MKRLLAVLVLAVLASACSTADSDDATGSTTTVGGDPVASTTTPESSTTTQIASPALPPQLADHDLDMVVVGDRLLLLAIADSPSLRSQGLMGVTDLGDLDGMLFYWRHEASGGFWMKDTLIPLDIVWFDENGTYAGRASMVPCEADPCPTYNPDGNPDYRYAIEARPGDLDWVDESTVIVYSD